MMFGNNATSCSHHSSSLIVLFCGIRSRGARDWKSDVSICGSQFLWWSVSVCVVHCPITVPRQQYQAAFQYKSRSIFIFKFVLQKFQLSQISSQEPFKVIAELLSQ